MPLRQRAAEHGEILCEDIDQPAVDRARSGDHAVAGDLLLLHAEVDAIMLDVHVDFFERARVEQHGQPLARGQPPLGVLRRDALLPAAQRAPARACFQFLDGRRHDLSCRRRAATRQSRSVNSAADQLAQLAQLPFVVGAERQLAAKRGIADVVRSPASPVPAWQRPRGAAPASPSSSLPVPIEQFLLGGQHQLGLDDAIVADQRRLLRLDARPRAP